MKPIVFAGILALACSNAAFAQEEDRNTSTPTEPDNTRMNRNQDITAQDQAETATDRDITQRIRSSLVQKSDLSSNAKNVKVISRNGKVTLRGPVNSDQEKQAIGSVAEGIAGKENVTNQIEVQPTQ